MTIGITRPGLATQKYRFVCDCTIPSPTHHPPQADRIDTYICLRCLIVASFTATVSQVSSIVNSWMSPEEAVAALENKRQKVLKRFHKEEKDFQKLNEDLISVNHSKLLQQQQADQISNPSLHKTVITDSLQLLTASPDNSSSPSPTPTPVHQLPLDTSLVVLNLEKKETALRAEMESILLKLARIKAEEEEILSFFTLTLHQRFQLNDWMIGVQSLLWPKTSAEEDAGRPLLDSLPIGIVHAGEQAIKCGLDKVHDVRMVVDGFRWMTWCFQCLEILRLPPTSRQMKRLLDAACNCRFADDKVLKIISGISQRIM